MSLSQSQVVIELTLLTFQMNPLSKDLLKTSIKLDENWLKLVAKLGNKLEIENALAQGTPL